MICRRRGERERGRPKIARPPPRRRRAALVLGSLLPLRSCVTLNSLFLLAAVAFMASEEAGRQLKREMDQKREEARRIDYME